jgi:ATP-dependent RNA helicase DeaD
VNPQKEHETQLIEPQDRLPEATLEQLPEKLRQAVARAGWTELMPVQAKAIPYMLARRDLMVQSRTGSGKTGAFILPVLKRIDPNKRTCQALVLVPTRELARQVTRDAQVLSGSNGIRVVSVYGGVAYGPQLQGFRQGAHLVVGTPGRILDHLLKRNLSLKDLQILVFDEADRMLSMGFYPDMKEIQRYLPSRRINAYMFSATFPSRVLRLAKQFLREPEFLSLSRDQVHVTDTAHLYYMVPAMDKDRSLIRIIEIENPDSALIFCNTKANVHYVAVVLRRFGYNVDELSSDRSQKAREKIMARMRKGRIRFLVTTDVAARGIDLPDLSHVFLYEPPEDTEVYIHRAGRTGRAGASGTAISLVDPIEKIKLNEISKRFKIEMEERPLPSDSDVADLVSERTIVLLEASLRSRDRLKKERMRRYLPLADSLSESEDGLALIAMLLDDYYEESLSSPPPEMEADKEPDQKRTQQKRSHRSRRRRRRR